MESRRLEQGVKIVHVSFPGESLANEALAFEVAK